jgi:hypothetical protein
MKKIFKKLLLLGGTVAAAHLVSRHTKKLAALPNLPNPCLNF